MEVDMQGAEPDEPEMSFRRGYQQGAIELFYAIERFLDPATREVVRAWIEKEVYIWRVKAMLGRPPHWRLNMLADPKVCAVAALGNIPCRACLIGDRWPSRLVATAAEDRLNIH